MTPGVLTVSIVIKILHFLNSQMVLGGSVSELQYAVGVVYSSLITSLLSVRKLVLVASPRSCAI